MSIGKLTIALSVTERDLKRAGAIMWDAAKEGAPRDSGHLAQNIFMDYSAPADGVKEVEVYTNIHYASYVEFGTGPIGAANHAGISPDVNPVYTMHPWGIPAGAIDSVTARRMGLEEHTYEGRSYWIWCYGQPAKPFMYPALRDNEAKIIDFIEERIKKKIAKAARKND